MIEESNVSMRKLKKSVLRQPTAAEIRALFVLGEFS